MCLTLLTLEQSFPKKHMFVRSIHVFACVTGVYYKPKESGIEYNIEFELVESIGRTNELNIHRWNKNNVTLLLILEPACGISTLLLLSFREVTI